MTITRGLVPPAKMKQLEDTAARHEKALQADIAGRSTTRQAPKKPGEGADPAAHVGHTIKIPMPLYEKIAWIKDNVPGASHRSTQKIVVEALTLYADRMIIANWKD